MRTRQTMLLPKRGAADAPRPPSRTYFSDSVLHITPRIANGLVVAGLNGSTQQLDLPPGWSGPPATEAQCEGMHRPTSRWKDDQSVDGPKGCHEINKHKAPGDDLTGWQMYPLTDYHDRNDGSRPSERSRGIPAMPEYRDRCHWTCSMQMSRQRRC